MTNYEAVALAEGFFSDSAPSSEDQVLEAWQHLVDTGIVWTLQGWFGRTATALIEAGEIQEAEA